MSLRIDDPEALRLARELAERTGESLTTAVTVALRGRLERETRRRVRAERLLAIGRDCASRLRAPYDRADHADPLYGETGLPT